jgi:hypothetical protein
VIGALWVAIAIVVFVLALRAFWASRRSTHGAWK